MVDVSRGVSAAGFFDRALRFTRDPDDVAGDFVWTLFMTVALLAFGELAKQHDEQPIYNWLRLLLRQVLPELLQSNARAGCGCGSPAISARGGTAGSDMTDLLVQVRIRSRKADSTTILPAPEVHRSRCEFPDFRLPQGKYKLFLEMFSAWTISAFQRVR